MSLNERHHAFLSARFYQELLGRCPGNGEATFVMATQRYGEQRGSRMAQRAIRDGRELDFAAYHAYGEWSYTEDFFVSGRHLELISESPDYRYQVHACPWHDQYLEMDLLEGACLYCRHIDLAIVRGFNPQLSFEVLSTLHKGDRCDFVMKNAHMKEKAYSVNKAKTQMPFDYHCGHLYHTFAAVVISIQQEMGREICRQVLAEFRARYGEPLLETVLSYANVDFDVLP